MNMTAENRKNCEEVWIKRTGWNWTFEEFFSHLGYLEPNQELTLKSGQVMFGSDVSYWYKDWCSFVNGWRDACEFYNMESKKSS